MLGLYCNFVNRQVEKERERGAQKIWTLSFEGWVGSGMMNN